MSSDTNPQSSAPNGSTTRRFAPVPIETTTRSSRRRTGREENSNTKEYSPLGNAEHIENSSGSTDKEPSPPRRFRPEPVETTTRSSRRKLPQPEETLTKSTRQRNGTSPGNSNDAQPKRKFLPEPVETTSRRRGGRNSRNFDDEDREMVDAPSRQSSTGSNSSGLRKFSPELIETVRGSYRQRAPGEASPEYPHSPAAHGFAIESPHGSPKLRNAVPHLHESRFSAANLAKRQEKRHSFIVPDLPSIQSDSSGESPDDSSGATSPSTMSGGKTAKTKKSSVEQISDRLLDLAARVAERQLREQALAAFPNERSYHPVDHYALEGEEEEEETRPGILSPQGDVSVSRFRRDSAADLDLELLKMRQHHNNLEKIEEEVKKRTLGIGDSKFSAAALAAKKGISLDKRSEDPVKVVGQWQKGAGLAQMRNAASPPMLGGDIKFPFSVSPKMTRCDVDQAPVPRRQDSDGDVEMDEQQLWSAKINVENDKDAGLWMGTCANSHSGTPVHDIRRSGLMTPSVEIDDPFNSLQNKERSSLFMQQLPLRPSASRPNPSADSINQMLQVEKEIEKEFNDAFVTQIYNYLSLGYPSLAHPFDEELSKISRMSIEELRKDDLRTDAKGYVGAPEGRGLEAADVAEGKCARWTALKLYIREWARQHPNMSERYPQEWGARARRGSWAI